MDGLASVAGLGIDRRRVAPRPLLLALAALLALAPSLGVARSLQSDDAVSPAVGHAAVIAHGVASLAGEDLAWRLAVLTVDPADGVGEVAASLGFLLADAGTLMLGDPGGERRARLAPGEAIFLEDDLELALAALGENQATYYEFALLPVIEVADGGSGAAVHTGQPFPAPGGDHDLDLVRAALADGEETPLPEGSGPTLVLATDGTLEVALDAGAAPTTLTSGEAAEFVGAVTVRATGGDASFAAAVVGPEVADSAVAVPRSAGRA